MGSNKLLNKPEDRAKMKELSEALKQAGLNNKVEDGYEDYGANMQWTNLTSDGTWVLNPREWMDYMNGNKSLEETVDSIVNGEYGINSGQSVFKWNKQEEKPNPANDWHEKGYMLGRQNGLSDEESDELATLIYNFMKNKGK